LLEHLRRNTVPINAVAELNNTARKEKLTNAKVEYKNDSAFCEDFFMVTTFKQTMAKFFKR